MMKRLYALLLSFTVLSQSYAGVFIPPSCRVANEAPGYCCWAAIATLARAQGISSLANLKESRKADPDGYIQEAKWTGRSWQISQYYVPAYGGTTESVLHKFASLGFTSYKYQRCGNFDKSLLYTALRSGHGAVVQVNWADEFGEGSHAVVITELNDQYVKFVNSNGCNEEVRSRQWFEENWDGFVITLD